MSQSAEIPSHHYPSTAAYKRESPSASHAEAQSHAKLYEGKAYGEAASKAEYGRICQNAIDEIEATNSVVPATSSPQQLEDVSEGESPTGGIDIGEFKTCLHHADGLLSTIYRSRSKDGQLVALKVTTPHLMTRPHDSRREVRILREAASVHVIALLSVFEVAGGQLIIVFPFMKYNLDTLLHRDALTGAQVKSHLQDMFRALSYVHSLGVIHRDVKPSNILLNSPAGPAYLADFGISWKDGVSSSEPATEKIIDVGTTCYRPPELLFGSREYDTSLDLWAAGCVVAETVEMNHKPLFDSGPLGSELSLIQSIFKTLGTPDEEMWPEIVRLPHWGKVEFYQYPPKRWEDILKGASTQARDLVSRLVRYECRLRLSAADVAEHPYFSVSQCDKAVCPT